MFLCTFSPKLDSILCEVMNKIRVHFFFAVIGLIVAGACCKKDPKSQPSCYDAELYEKYKNAMCTADCPGVKGCDGKQYCNECEANSRGIRVVK